VQPIRSVRIKFFQSAHLTNLGRDSHECAAIEVKTPYRLQFGNGPWEFDDRPPSLPSQFVRRIELASPVVGSFVDKLKQLFPGITRRVLALSMQSQRRPAPVLILRLKTFACWLIVQQIAPLPREPANGPVLPMGSQRISYNPGIPSTPPPNGRALSGGHIAASGELCPYQPNASQ